MLTNVTVYPLNLTNNHNKAATKGKKKNRNVAARAVGEGRVYESVKEGNFFVLQTENKSAGQKACLIGGPAALSTCTLFHSGVSIFSCLKV